MNPTPPNSTFSVTRRQRNRWPLIWERMVQVFFGGNALVAVLVLTMIMVFLVREGAGFFRQNWENLRLYRAAGLEFVEPLRQQEKDHAALSRYLFDLRVRAAQHYANTEGWDRREINQHLAGIDDYIFDFNDAGSALQNAVFSLSDMASEIKLAALAHREELRPAAGNVSGAVPERFDFETAREPLYSFLPTYGQINDQLAVELDALVHARAPEWPTPELEERFARFVALTQSYTAGFPAIERTLARWDPEKPVPGWKAWSTFLTGSQWLTASFWQDWYGVLPLFTGSVLVAFIALVFAVPLGVGAALYVSQMASRREQSIVKPAIEFIAAIPSVVLGFFGIVVLGEALRVISQQGWLDGVPGFPIVERLNALTAGLLLALVAVPTIFTLAEDAFQNVPRTFREASYALGATRWQTIRKVIFPTALSGIISAVLLGFGRVIGETMIVLLCAGNRIAIPDFTKGLEAFTQPVHTMTGIIAQEMGEVVQGGIHYRALFVVGLLLFFITLIINYFAQRIVQRYRISLL